MSRHLIKASSSATESDFAFIHKTLGWAPTRPAIARTELELHKVPRCLSRPSGPWREQRRSFHPALSSFPAGFLLRLGILQRLEQVLDGHALAEVGVDEAGSDSAVPGNDEGRRNWQDPRVIPLIVGELPAAGFENLLHFVADPDREVERKC